MTEDDEDAAAAWGELAAVLVGMDAADALVALAIFESGSQAEVIALIRAYYADRERADRTPRALLYAHLGILTGIAGGFLYGRRPS